MYPILIPMLSDPDPEARCTACEAILLIDARQGVSLASPLLEDHVAFVRINACHALGKSGDRQAIEPLIAALERDPDPDIRTAAAYALGLICSLAAIPTLLRAMDSGHETAWDGHSASSCAASALNNILGTDETCIHEGVFCRMRGEPPDLERLRRLAEALHAEWSTGRA